MTRRHLPAALLAVAMGTALGCGASVDRAIDLSSSSTVSSPTAGSQTTKGLARKVRQRAQLFMHPQIAGPGKTPQSAVKAESAMTAVLKPGRKGRKVQLQRKAGGGWKTVTTRRQNGQGVTEFTAPYVRKGRVQTYRVRGLKKDNLKPVTSKGVKTSKWGDADFTDQFAGSALGPDWSTREQGYQPNSYRACSKADDSAVTVAGGVARISVLDDPLRPSPADVLNGTERCTPTRVSGTYDWRLNGHIGTQATRSFLYGYAAARVKFQNMRGQHGSFWLQPTSRAASEGSAEQTGAEIDVIEYFGDDHPSGGLTSFIYHYPDNAADGVTPEKLGGFIKKPRRFGEKWSSSYHVFSVEWTPERYIFRIDGKETFRITDGVSGRQQFLILSLLSSDYELGFLGGANRLPQTMSVDWVRYWER